MLAVAALRAGKCLVRVQSQRMPPRSFQRLMDACGCSGVVTGLCGAACVLVVRGQVRLFLVEAAGAQCGLFCRPVAIDAAWRHVAVVGQRMVNVWPVYISKKKRSFFAL
ncbi:MAG: hypothetical protein Q8J78_09355 [Moraxellaceae bacterium]|nr:hypothetical protein [Moraxellaceae bacterium]